MSRTPGGRDRTPLSTTSVVLFVVVFAANLLALLPVLIRPTGSNLDHPEPAPFIAPATLFVIVVAVAALTLPKRHASGWAWVRWVVIPSLGLALCVLSMPVLWFSIPLAIFAGVSLLGQVVVMGVYGYTGADNPLG